MDDGSGSRTVDSTSRGWHVAAVPEDGRLAFQREVLASLEQFWGDRDMRSLHHPVWFHQFGDAALAARDEGGALVGYLLGALTTPVSYVHLVAARADHTGAGIGRRLYDRFAAAAIAAGANHVEAITMPGNSGSIAFHRRLGFAGRTVEDHAGPGEVRIVFRKNLTEAGHTGIDFALADLDDRRVVEFLDAHLDELAPTAPPESRHGLDVAALRSSPARLWVATTGETIVGCGALVPVEEGHEELKSMRTDPDWRGRGVGAAILAHLIADARARSIRRLSLETGTMAFFAPARALYARAGFVACPPFGHYAEVPNSTFMTLDLRPPDAGSEGAGLAAALHAGAPDGDRAAEMDTFGRFIGSWHVDWYGSASTDEPEAVGELHFGWVLGGRAIQDVWIVPGPGQPGTGVAPRAFHGSTLRFYDRRLGAWRSTWIEPINGRVRRFIGRPAGEDIELISLDGEPLLRWRFSAITPDSFWWTGEQSTDEGRSWLVEERMHCRRRR